MNKIKTVIIPILFILGCVSLCHARIIQFDTANISEFSDANADTWSQHKGEIIGELTTSESIPGLIKADDDEDGRVSYRSTYSMIYQKHPKDRMGTLVFDTPNRGRPIAEYLYNATYAPPRQHADHEPDFIKDQGFMYVTANWELSHGTDLPAFTDANGKNQYAEGVGFAIVRDIVSFLRYEEEDPSGQANPVAGSVTHTIGVGYSQSARFLKSFLIHGFNSCMGKPVFDGMHLQASHSGLLPVLTIGTGPASSGSMFPTFNMPDLPGVHTQPFTYAAINTAAKAKGSALPLIIATNMSNDYYSLRASLARTGPSGITDVAIPSNIRIYDVAGSAHMILDAPGCKYTRGNLNWHPVMRAVLLHLNNWIKTGQRPPDNRLMPLAPANDNPKVLPPPKESPQAIIMIPITDQDGNDVGGVRLPDIQVPQGTYAGQNEPLDNFFCSLSGVYIPFMKTLEQRKAMGDLRPSIAERYPDCSDYISRFTTAVNEIVKQKFMLEEDALAIIEAAEQSDSCSAAK